MSTEPRSSLNFPYTLRKMRIRTVIIDDETNAREAIRSILEFNYPNIQIVGEADGVFSGLNIIQETKPELVFLDIKMDDGSGFDLLNRLHEINFATVFLTAYDEYAIKAFRHAATDYLLKPIDTDDLDSAIRKVQKNIGRPQIDVDALLNSLHKTDSSKKKVVLKTSSSIHLVNKSDIIRCEASGNYTEFFFKNRKPLLVSKSLKEYEEILSPLGFFRSHQSHLVSIAQIRSVEKRDGFAIVLSDGCQIPVATRKKEALMKLLDDI